MIPFMVSIAITNCLFAKSANDSTQNKKQKPANDAGLKLPPGFTAVKFAEGLGEARHLAVTPQGDVYVKLSALKNGKSIYYLHDANGDGKADVKTGFGDFTGTEWG